MLVASYEIIEQLATTAVGYGQDTEAEIDDVDWAARVEVPSMSRSGWKRHLARR